MGYRFVSGALLLLAGCSQQAPAEPINASAEAMVAVPTPAVADDAPLAQWLAGSWSYDEACGTDLSVHFNPDGTMESAVEQGRWQLEGDSLTVTVTSRIEADAEGKAAEAKVDPPETRRYAVARQDAGHGVLTLGGNPISIQRC